MNKVLRVMFFSMLAACLVTGCQTTKTGKNAGAARGNKLPNAGNTSIFILIDPATDGLAAAAVRSRQQIADYMNKDTVRIFSARGGYKAQTITARDQYKAGPDAYLLTIKITKYNPGSKAARIVVGLGAGACSLDIHYELHGAGQAAILANNDGVGSSIEWNRLVRKLNENMLAAVNTKLAEHAAP